ncbi:hypothetical protein J4477_04225 [Candidatus Pacearchaeota archaeon]|nr:hypothetical protein [Candidatus Pacearchaeota archaeon]
MISKKGIVIGEHIDWIIAAVLLFILLIFLMSIPLSKWISFFPDYNYDQNDTYVGDVAPDFKLPSGEVRYCPGKIGEPDYQGFLGKASQYNPFSNPTQYISFWNFNTKNHDIRTSFYLKGSSEEGVIYFKEAGDIAIADVVNGAVLLRPEILDSTSKERYLIWFNFLSNKPSSSKIEFLVRLISLDRSIIYPGNYICHPDNWKIPQYSNLWPAEDVVFISSINRNGDGEYVIDLSPYFDAEDAGFEHFYINRLGSYNFYGQTFIYQSYLTIKGKNSFLGADFLWKDKAIGIILKDGNVLLNKDYYDEFLNNEFRDVILTDPNLNIDESLFDDNYRTNLYVSESKVSELFENLK